jgi:dihydrofolate reductase
VVVSLIAAVAENRVIGHGGQLPWHLPADLAWFKRWTLGHWVILGRRTWESFRAALPDRTLVVVTSDPAYDAPGCRVAADLGAALDLAQAAGQGEVFIAGGARLYAEALPRAQRFYLTEVGTAPPGDTFFPPWRRDRWRVVFAEEHPADERNPYPCRFLILERRDRKIKGSPRL